MLKNFSRHPILRGTNCGANFATRLTVRKDGAEKKALEGHPYIITLMSPSEFTLLYEAKQSFDLVGLDPSDGQNPYEFT